MFPPSWRRPATLPLLLSAALSATALSAEAQPAPAAARPAPHAMTPADIAAWKTLRGATLSNDGAWFAYIQAPNEGDAEVIVRQTSAGGKVHRFPIGEAPAAGGGPGGGGTAGLQLSGDGKWVAMLVYPKAADAKRLSQQRRPIQTKALVVNLATGEQKEFERVRRIQLGGDAPRWLAMHAYGPDAPAGGGAGGGGGPAPGAPGMGGNLFGGGGGGGATGTDLLLHELGTSTLFNVGNVSDFAFDDKARWLAYTIDARERIGNGVQLRDLSTGVVQSLDADKALYRRLAWSDTLPALSWLKGTVDSAATDTTWAALAIADIGRGNRRVTVGAGGSAALPNGMEVSPDRTPRWTERMDGLVFGLRVATVPVPRSERLEDDERPTLILWHGKDARLQSQQLVQEQADRGFSFIATLFPETGKVVQLTDEVVRTG
ncbi:MAG: hypothetical protein IBJ19_10535, partial [Gemmatimonadaceae bacterium]|nr:hypothetical protein [Gemmatimonadaceae bacterium]